MIIGPQSGSPSAWFWFSIRVEKVGVSPSGLRARAVRKRSLEWHGFRRHRDPLPGATVKVPPFYLATFHGSATVIPTLDEFILFLVSRFLLQVLSRSFAPLPPFLDFSSFHSRPLFGLFVFHSISTDNRVRTSVLPHQFALVMVDTVDLLEPTLLPDVTMFTNVPKRTAMCLQKTNAKLCLTALTVELDILRTPTTQYSRMRTLWRGWYCSTPQT